MAEHIFKELGYLSVSTCEEIKEAMQGKTFLDFRVDFTNQAGNCTLVVRNGADSLADGSTVTEKELTETFMSGLAVELALERRRSRQRNSVLMPQMLNELTKSVIERSEEWKRMVCTNDDRSEFVYAQMEQLRKQIDAEMERLRSSGYKVAFGIDGCVYYAIKGDALCQVL